MSCKSVLVVEDDPAIREMLRAALELEGYRVDIAENGRQAVDLFPSLPRPCLILLDLMMPVMNGWEFAAILEKDQVLATIPIVVVTAFTEKDRRVNGAKKVLKKPIDLNLLIETVREYCGDEPAGKPSC